MHGEVHTAEAIRYITITCLKNDRRGRSVSQTLNRSCTVTHIKKEGSICSHYRVLPHVHIHPFTHVNRTALARHLSSRWQTWLWFFFLNETESRVLVCMVLSFPFYIPCYSGVFSFLELTYVCTVKYTNAGTNTTIAIHIFLPTKHANISFLETSWLQIFSRAAES